MWLVKMMGATARADSKSYRAFLWVYTGCWVAGLVLFWANYSDMGIFAKIAVSLLLVLTTPPADELFSSRHRNRNV